MVVLHTPKNKTTIVGAYYIRPKIKQQFYGCITYAQK